MIRGAFLEGKEGSFQWVSVTGTTRKWNVTRDHSAARASQQVPRAPPKASPVLIHWPQPPRQLNNRVPPLPRPPLPAGDNRRCRGCLPGPVASPAAAVLGTTGCRPCGYPCPQAAPPPAPQRELRWSPWLALLRSPWV